MKIALLLFFIGAANFVQISAQRGGNGGGNVNDLHGKFDLIFLLVMVLSGGFRGGGWGGCIPPTSLKVTILAEKSASILNNSAPFRDASPPHRPKRNESGRKISLNSGEDLFFFLEIT